jgi:hypothetical protein
MNRAAVAFRVAGSTAAAVALTIPPEPHAAPAEPARVADAPVCTYGGGSYVIRLNSWVRVAGQVVFKERTPLAAGQRVETGPAGGAVVCLSRQRWWCRVRPTTLFSVGPRTGVVVQMVGDDGRLVCYGQYDARWKLRKRGEMLTSDGMVDLKPL